MTVKPGITGLWQVSGRSKITDFEEIVRLDREYIENWRLKLDVKILLKNMDSLGVGKDAAAQQENPVQQVQDLVDQINDRMQQTGQAP